MNKFKVGDLVRLRHEAKDPYLLYSKKYEVSGFHSDGYFVTLKDHPKNGQSDFDSSKDWVSLAKDFELAAVMEEITPASMGLTSTASAAILEEALSITQGARNTTHGAKERSFKATAGLWNAYLAGRKEGSEAPLTARNVSDLMELLKIGRSIQGTPVRDHFTDRAGYAALSGELAEAEAS